jgi:hypothetical protein
MDLRLFHPQDNPERNYKRMDRLNSRTGSFACRTLERIGWYNSSLANRLLGHYRLYQLFKSNYPQDTRDIPVARAYILQYRATHGIKYFFTRFATLLSRFIPGVDTTSDPLIEVQGINRILLQQRPDILEQFLVASETDFDQAFLHALHQINNPAILSTGPITNSQTLVRINQDHHLHSYNAFHVHPVIKQKPDPNENSDPTPEPPTKPGTHGKEKGVFSKKQVLLLFDLIAQTANIERIDPNKPNRFHATAELLQALTGRGKDSWLAELNDYKGKDLYEWHTPGQLNQLISTLINLAELFRKAGFDKIAKLADKKLRELELKKNRQ